MKNSPISRRELLALVSACLPLASCLNISTIPKQYKVFWLHLEGAPFRALFDLWPSLGEAQSFLPGVENHPIKLDKRNLSLPKVWHQAPKAQELLSHWLCIRGITTQSPHLAQCRKEWFDSRHDEANLLAKPKRGMSIGNVFKDWKSSSQPLEVLEKEKITPYIIDSIKTKSGATKFENINELNKESVALYSEFYTNLLSELSSLVSLLKKQQTFNQSVIMITSDRGRAPASKTFPMIIEPVWQGAPVSLISGAIHGPVNIGNIYKSHPKYSQAYPGTWGTPVQQWTPKDIHSLLAELYSPKKENKKNPWISPKPLQGFFVKLPPGTII